MSILDLIVEFGRDDHIARHNVTMTEVEEVVFGMHSIRRERNGYYRLVGQTDAGRYLTIFVVPFGGGVYSLVTARDATASERRKYRKQRRAP